MEWCEPAQRQLTAATIEKGGSVLAPPVGELTGRGPKTCRPSTSRRRR